MFNHIDLKSGKESDLGSVEINGFRFYRIDDEQGQNYYPSVTTVTGYSKRDFFEKWAKDPKNKKIKRLATERGNAVHDSLEKYLLNNDKYLDGMDDIHRDIVLLMKPFIDKHINNVHALEYPLYSHTLKMAGRVDCVAEFDNELSIIDYKGSFKEKKESYIENYFQQGTSYALMWQERFNVPIDNVIIIIGCETGIVQIFKRKTYDMIESLAECVNHFHAEMKNNHDYQLAQSGLLI